EIGNHKLKEYAVSLLQREGGRSETPPKVMNTVTPVPGQMSPRPFSPQRFLSCSHISPSLEQNGQSPLLLPGRVYPSPVSTPESKALENFSLESALEMDTLDLRISLPSLKEQSENSSRSNSAPSTPK